MGNNKFRLKHLKKIVIWMAILCLFILGFILNFYTYPYVDLYIFLVLPCILAAWYFGLYFAFILIFICAFSWFYTGIKLEVGVPMWAILANVILRSVIFGAFVLLANYIYKLTILITATSQTDGLTGLPNRRLLYHRGKHEMMYARRHKTPLSLVFIDVDNFKKVNDVYGHVTGDKVLREIARALSNTMRATDFVSRLGGDEFVILFPNTDGCGAKIITEKMIRVINKIVGRYNHLFSVSAGIVTLKDKPLTFKLALQMADQVMYEVKKAGKNAILQRDA